MKTVTALYGSFDTARQVTQALLDAGMERDHIGLVASDASGEYTTQLQTSDMETDDVSGGEGAGFGATVGTIFGAVAGLVAITIPGIGPVIAAGPLAAALGAITGAGIGAVSGAVAGGITASLVQSGLDEETAGYYAEGLRRGGALLTVQVEDNRADEIADIMNDYDPIDVNTRASEWKASGWQGFSEQAAAYSPSEIEEERSRYSTGTTTAGGEEQKLQVVEEELQVGKREVGRGGVRVHTYITETPVQEQVNLREEHVVVERNPVNRVATEADFAHQESTIEMEERAEELVVNKQARVVEEVTLRKDVQEHTETVNETLRRQDVEVEQMSSKGYDTYTPDFRQHYTTTYGTGGQSYENYDPAYRYGYTLASDARYRDYDWQRLENDARSGWESSYAGPWEDFKDAVRYAWEKVKAALR
jgi:uncharacterized protein (TIGR02271 family)